MMPKDPAVGSPRHCLQCRECRSISNLSGTYLRREAHRCAQRYREFKACESRSGFEPVFFAKGASKLFALCPATAAAGTSSRSRGAILAVACTIPRVLDGKKGPSPPSLEPRCGPYL